MRYSGGEEMEEMETEPTNYDTFRWLVSYVFGSWFKSHTKNNYRTIRMWTQTEYLILRDDYIFKCDNDIVAIFECLLKVYAEILQTKQHYIWDVTQNNWVGGRAGGVKIDLDWKLCKLGHGYFRVMAVLLLSVFEIFHEKMVFRWVWFPNICPMRTKDIRGKQRLLTGYSQKCQRDEKIDAPVHARS